MTTRCPICGARGCQDRGHVHAILAGMRGERTWTVDPSGVVVSVVIDNQLNPTLSAKEIRYRVN